MAMQYTGIPIYIEKYRVKVQGQSTGSKKEGKVSNILIYIERVKYIYIKNSILNFKSEKNITNSESKGKSKMFSPLCLKYVSICFFFIQSLIVFSCLHTGILSHTVPPVDHAIIFPSLAADSISLGLALKYSHKV